MLKLLEFPQSHYCEKVRWSLDWKGLAWESERLVPGAHRVRVKKIAPETSLPVLIDGDRCIQGSHEIVSYLDEAYPQRCLTPKDPQRLRESLALERTLDKDLGTNLVLIVYYWLFQSPRLLNHYYMSGLPLHQRSLFFLAYPLINRLAKKKYGITPERHTQRCRDFEIALDQMDERLTNKPFLMGDELTRVDLCAATILAAIVRPDTHPIRWPESQRPKKVVAFFENYQQRPSFQWASQLYEKYRPEKSSA